MVLLVGLAAACGRGALVGQVGSPGTTGPAGSSGSSGSSGSVPGADPSSIGASRPPAASVVDPTVGVTTLTFYAEGSDADVDVALGLLRERIETTGVAVRSLDAASMLTNGSGKRPVTLTVAGASPARELAWLVERLVDRGVPDLAGVLSSRRVGSHYPLDCHLGFAAGAICFLLDGSVGHDDLVASAAATGSMVSVSWREPHVVDGLRRACLAHEPVCPSGSVALTIDGTVVGQAALDGPDLDPASLAVSLPDNDPRQVTIQAAILTSGPLPIGFRATFSPDPTPPACASCGVVSPTTAPPSDGAIPMPPPVPTSAPVFDPNSATTAPGPGATARFCPDPSASDKPTTTSTTRALDC